jgi:nitrogen fixation protein FixH
MCFILAVTARCSFVLNSMMIDISLMVYFSTIATVLLCFIMQAHDSLTGLVLDWVLR